MAVVTYVSKDSAAEELRPILDDMALKAGSVPHVYAALAHSPALMEAFHTLNGALAKTQLDGKLRELAYIKTSELNGCEYCLHYHRLFGRKAGLTERQASETANYESSDAYDDLQRTVLRYAEEVTRHIDATDDVLGRLRQSLSDREIVELAATVGIANFSNRITQTLRLELP